MRVLIGTNHLERLSGSETVAFEFASYFVEAGLEVAVFANWSRPPMAKRFRTIGLTPVTDPKTIRPFEYDLIYFQHHVAGLFNYELMSTDRTASIFAFGRLSPFGFMESGGWKHEEALADVVYANSPETERALENASVRSPLHVFHNAAPDAFHLPPRKLPSAPTSILVVTNHRDPTVLEAVAQLRQHVRVLHVGRSGDEVRAVNPKLVRQHDLILSIGKTVQYALAAHIPIFVYDHFGGPGYLDASNFSRAADFNFSGRCTPTKRSSAELVAEIFAGYAAARNFSLKIGEETLRPFILSNHLGALMRRPPSANATRQERVQAAAGAIGRERLLAEHIRSSYRQSRRLESRVEALQVASERGSADDTLVKSAG